MSELPIVERLREGKLLRVTSGSPTSPPTRICMAPSAIELEAATLIRELVEALEPFAKAYENDAPGEITMGDLANAVEILAKAKQPIG